MPARALIEDAPDCRIIDFLHGLASAAHEQLSRVLASGERAADERVERIDAVNQAGVHQEVQGPVNRRRRGSTTGPIQLVEDIVGLDRFMTTPHDFQYASPGRRQAETPVPAVVLCIGKGICDAGRMIMICVSGAFS